MTGRKSLLATVLSFALVFVFSSAAWATDTDGDGLSDNVEIAIGTLVNNANSDGDSLNDYAEFFGHGTDPLLDDTDGDGDSDSYEVAHSTDPLDPGGNLDGVSAFSGSTYPVTNDFALSGASPVDGAGVYPHDGHLSYSVGVANAKGLMFPFGFRLFYDSSWNFNGPYGMNVSALAHYSVDVSGNFHLFKAGCGELVWTYVSPGVYTPPPGGSPIEIDKVGSDYTLTSPNGVQETYSGGNLVSVKDRYGNGTTYAYTGSQCDSATDSRGETHTFDYWSSTHRLKSITMADGRIWTFRYNLRAQLMRIEGPPTTEFPGGIWQEFRYTNGSSNAFLNNNMIAAIDGRGNAWMTATYDANDRVDTQTVGGGTYVFDYSSIGSQQTAVTDRNLNERVWTWDAAMLTKTSLVERTNRTVRASEPDYTTTWHADADGYVDSVTYPRLNGVHYVLNAAKLPTEVRRKEVLSDPDDPLVDLIDTYTYDSGQFYAMTGHTDAEGNHTGITLDGNGRPATITYETISATAVTEHDYFVYNGDGTTYSHTDRGGTVTQYAYYSSGPRTGRVQTATVDPGGLALATDYDYTDWGDVASITRPNGVATSYTVEAYGNVTEIDVGSMGYVTKFEHDGNLNVTKKSVKNIDETGSWRSNPYWIETNTTYTVMDKVQSVSQFVASTAPVPVPVTNYGYDANDNLTSVSRGGKGMDLAYDERDLLYQRIRDPGLGCVNATETFDYDGNRNLAAYENARGYSTTKAYDYFDRLTTTTNALGHYEELSYDKDGHVTERQSYDYNGGSPVLVAHHKNHFDEMGRLWKEEDLLIGGGGTWYERTMVLDGRGNPTTVTDRNTHDTTNVYDALGRLETRTDALGNHVDFTYWYDGSVATQIETENVPGGGTEAYETDFAYDDLYRRTSQTVIDANNALNTKVTTWALDCLSAVCSTTDPMGYVTTSTYDSLGRVLSRTEPLHGSTTATTHWIYDENEKLVELVDDNGKRTRYDYDTLNYLTTTTYDYVAPASPNPTTTVTSFVPDANGNVSQWTDPNGTVVTQTFDDLDRLTARSASLGSGVGGDTSETFAYDALNRMTQAADNDSTVDYVYDSLSRPKTEAQIYGGNTKTTTYTTWNAEGGLEQLDYAGGFSAHRSYDDVDRLTGITDGTNSVASFALYGPGGRLKKTTLGNTTHTEYAYDGYRRPTAIDHQDNVNASFAGFQYDYDANDNPLYEARTHKSGHGDVYSYDKLNRLASVLVDCANPAAEIATPSSQTYATKSDFTMDGVFNILAHDSTLYGGSPATTSYAVNALNEYTTAGAASPAYDENGNLTDDGTHTYVYDFHNHLIEAKTGGSTIGTYKYDAVGRGRRIRRVAGGATIRYVYAGDQAIEEYDGSNSLQRSFVFGDGIDQVLFMKVASSKYYIHTQLIGSVTTVTDASQAVVESYEYGPYGETTIKNGGGGTISATAIGNRYGFTGRQFDEETGLYYYRARHYSPNLRRFVQRDPLEYVDGPSAFAYVICQPTSRVDPLGEREVSEEVRRKFEAWLPKRDLDLPPPTHFTDGVGLGIVRRDGLSASGIRAQVRWIRRLRPKIDALRKKFQDGTISPDERAELSDLNGESDSLEETLPSGVDSSTYDTGDEDDGRY